jgi:hypothetical protein
MRFSLIDWMRVVVGTSACRYGHCLAWVTWMGGAPAKCECNAGHLTFFFSFFLFSFPILLVRLAELATGEEGDVDTRSVRVTVPNTALPTAVWNSVLWYLGSNDFGTCADTIQYNTIQHTTTTQKNL